MARNKQVSDEQLVETARATFLELGPHIPVAVIAKRLGVTPAALFHRVGSKEELLRLALRPRSPLERVRLQEGFKRGDPPVDQLIEILTGLCRYMSSGVPAIFLMHAGGVPTPADNKGEPFKEPQMIALRREIAAWMVQAFKSQKMPKARAEVLADAFMGTLEGRFMHAYLQGNDFSDKQNHAFIKNLVVEVIGK